MAKIIKQLWLVITLIILASLILLLSSRNQRIGHKETQKAAYPAIAVMQMTSTSLLDSHVAGIISRLKEKGYRAANGENIRIFNPQGDYATATAISQEIAASNYKIVITSSTLALQSFSQANLVTRKPHIFGAVTDPYGTGVGISGPEPDQHPAYMTGIGTFQPVKSTIRLARTMNPALKRLGVVWNPSEQCSEACLKQAREICAELQIELIESSATNTSEVSEAARAVIAKGAEAIWVGGDTVANASIRLLIKLADQANIPVFTNDPKDVDSGALFGIGADYFTVGQHTADIAIAVLEGKNPADFRIDNVIPEQLAVNQPLVARLGEHWQLTAEIHSRLKAQNRATVAALPIRPEPGKTYRIGLNHIVPSPTFDIAIQGFKDGLKKLGFIEGKNLELNIQHANGDMSMLPQSITSLTQNNPDILIAMSTPSLGSAIAHSHGINIAFAIVSAPLGAGAGNSFTDHLPQVTGIAQQLPSPELIDWAVKLMPHMQRIGVLFNPSEANSVKEIQNLEQILEPRHIELKTVAINTTGEVPEAILGLLAKNIDLMFSIGDNTVASAMPAIVNTCQRHGIPVIAEDISLMGTGALFSCAPGPYSDGYDLATLTAKILLGASPADIPITSSENKELTVDFSALKTAGIKPPLEMVKQADVFFNLQAKNGRPLKIILVNLIENDSLLNAIQGVEDALAKKGLRAGVDFTLKKFCAQGDMNQLPQILDQVAMEHPDALVTVTTPVLSAAVKRNFEFPVVFTVGSDPKAIGLFKNGRPQNLCGVHDDPPLDQVLAMARKHNPTLSSVGTIYDPAQINSQISVEKLSKAGIAQNIKVLKASVSAITDLKMATQSIIQRGAEAIILSADNLVTAGFTAVHKAAQAANIPIYVTEIDLIEKGADGAVGDSFYDWGIQSGKLLGKVLAGVPPSALPIMPTQVQITVEPEKTAPVENVQPYKLSMVLYSETEFAERSREGILAGLRQGGLVEGQDYTLHYYNAQGDISTLSSIMTTIKSDQVDMLLVVSTPTLQAALSQAGEQTKIVFTGVGDGVKAGAGKSETDHLTNVTGISTRSPFVGMAKIIRQTLPTAHRVGTLFTPGEINSVLYKNWFKDALEKEGIELVEIAVNSSADVAQAAIELVSQDIQALAQVVDNLTRPGFALIARKATEKNLPIYVFDSDQMKHDGDICLAIDYFDAGVEAAQKAVRILKGEQPRDIPFSNTSSERLMINPELAHRHHLTISAEMMDRATIYAAERQED
jgi:ABC-type uncharacterized transport system substrate-binding protein